MESKDGDRSSSGLPQTLGAGDAKPAAPPSSVKNEVCVETLFCRKVFRIGTVCYNWPMSAHASQAFSIEHCTKSEDLPFCHAFYNSNMYCVYFMPVDDLCNISAFVGAVVLSFLSCLSCGH